MEEALDLHIDEETLKNIFSKKEQNFIKQLQSAGTDGKKGPVMTPQDRNSLMEKLHSINNKSSKNFKNREDMSPEELMEYKQDIKNRLRSKINFKTQSRGGTKSMGSLVNNKSNVTNDTTNTDNTQSPDPLTMDNMKNMISKMSGSNANPEIQQKLESLFSDNSIGDLMKNDSMKEQMSELMENKGFNDLFKQFTQQDSSAKKKKKPACVAENNKTNEVVDIEPEELLDEFIIAK